MSGRSRETIGSNIEQRHPSCLPFFLLFTSSFIFPLTSLFTSPLLLIYFSLSLLHITPTSNLTHTHTHTHFRRKHSDTSETGALRVHGRQPDAPPPKKQQRVESERKSKHSKFQEGYEEGSTLEHSMPKAKGDTPDRFWASVEPYCMDITEADLKVLQDGIRSVSVFLVRGTMEVLLSTMFSLSPSV